MSYSVDFEEDIAAPRVAFVSLYYFITQWDRLPTDILETCICLFTTVRRSSIFPTDSKTESKWIRIAKYQCSAEFREVLLIKESQNLLIWKPEESQPSIDHSHTHTNSSSLSLSLSSAFAFHPTHNDGTSTPNSQSCADMDALTPMPSFTPAKTPVGAEEDTVQPLLATSLLWRHVSSQLRSIVDPITLELYKPLCVDSHHWQHDSLVQDELQTGYGNFEAITTLITQSNPTIIPMVAYHSKPANNGIHEYTDKYGFTHIIYD